MYVEERKEELESPKAGEHEEKETPEETPSEPSTEEGHERQEEPEKEEKEETEESKEKEKGKDKTPPWFKKRIDRLVWEREEARREAAYWRGIAEGRMKQPSGEDTASDDKKPSPGDYESYDEYIEALTDWKTRQALKQIQTQQSSMTEEQKKLEAQRQFAERVEKARMKYDDFDEVVLNPYVPITDEMVMAIHESELGPDIAYYLGKHPEEAMRIARLSPVAQAREIGKIEARLSQPSQPAAKQQEPRRITKAPEPIGSGVSGKNTTPTPDPEKMTMEEWLRWREKQLRGG